MAVCAHRPQPGQLLVSCWSAVGSCRCAKEVEADQGAPEDNADDCDQA